MIPNQKNVGPFFQESLHKINIFVNFLIMIIKELSQCHKLKFSKLVTCNLTV